METARLQPRNNVMGKTMIAMAPSMRVTPMAERIAIQASKASVAVASKPVKMAGWSAEKQLSQQTKSVTA